MIREMGKSEGEEILRPKKLKNTEKPKGYGINSTNQYALGGHVACSVATMHLIWSKTPRVMDRLGKLFIFYGRRDTSWQPQKLRGN